MIDLIDLSGRKADLVAVGGIAGRGCGDELALRELARQRVPHRNGRVGRAGHAHGGIDVCAAGQRVADRAADAGGGAAERLDLGRVVVRFVLKQQQPVLFLSVHRDGHPDRAGIDLIGNVQLVELSLRLEVFCGNRAEIHETDRLCAPEPGAHGKIVLIRLLDKGVLKRHRIDLGQKRGMAAVVGPIGIQHAQFRDRGIAALLPEIRAAAGEIVPVHGESIPLHKLGERCIGKRRKAGERIDRRGDFIDGFERFGQRHGGLAALDRVDDVFFDLRGVRIREPAVYGVHLGGGHDGTLAGGEDLDALRRRIRTLVKLSRQILDRKHERRAGGIERAGHIVELRLCKHAALCRLEQLRTDILRIVAIDDAHALDARNAVERAKLLRHGARLRGERRLFFHIYSINHISPPRR